MTALEGALDGWQESTTEVTAPEDGRPTIKRQRSPEDGEVERITLRLNTPSGYGEAQLLGRMSWTLSRVMLDAWAGEGHDREVSFAIRFKDGQTLSGRVNIRRKSERNLAEHCRKVSTFRASFCPDLSAREATPMFRFFLSNYSVPAAQQEAQVS